jgi:hypothetical protein
MNTTNLIALDQLSMRFEIAMSFFTDLSDIGLIEIQIVDESPFVHEDHIGHLEKIIRIHNELHINIESIDVVMNLLQKIENMQEELFLLQNRLRIYELEE